MGLSLADGSCEWVARLQVDDLSHAREAAPDHDHDRSLHPFQGSRLDRMFCPACDVHPFRMSVFSFLVRL